MMKILMYGKIKNVPNHQPGYDSSALLGLRFDNCGDEDDADDDN